jgi:hypothetical protein
VILRKIIHEARCLCLGVSPASPSERGLDFSQADDRICWGKPMTQIDPLINRRESTLSQDRVDPAFDNASKQI